MNKYELALVLNAKIEEDQRVATLDKIKGYVTEANGTIDDVEEWGRKRLAYEIQKMNEGYYYFIHFTAESSAPAEIEKRVKIVDNVLRFLIVKQEA